MNVGPDASGERTSAHDGRVHHPRALASRLNPVKSRPALVFLGFILLAVVLFRHAWVSPHETWIGWPGDPPLHMWFLRWTPWALSHGHNPLFTTRINYPDGVNLMWDTAEPLTALVSAPLTYLIGTVFAYNVLITLAVAGSAWCAYLFIRRHVDNEVAAAVGGLLYGFSPYMVSQALTHSNLVQVFLFPLLAIVIEDMLVGRQRSYYVSGIVIGVLVSAQILITEEVLVYEFLAFAVATAVLLVVRWRDVPGRAGHVVRALLVAAVVSVVLVGGPLAFQFYGPEHVTHGSLHGLEAHSSDLLSFVVPTELQVVNPPWTKQVNDKFTDSCCLDEWGSYMGAPMLLLLIVAATLLWESDLVKVASIVAVVFIVLSMGPHLHVGGVVTSTRLPFAALQRLPLLQNVQPRRLMLVVYFAAAIVLALFADHVLRLRRPVAIAGVVAIVLALVPLLPTRRFPATKAPVPSFFRSTVGSRVPKNSVVLVAPFARNTSTSAPMLWQAEAGFRYKMPEGYIVGSDRSGQISFLPSPSGISDAMERLQSGGEVPALSATDRASYGNDLAQRRVRTVVVGPQQNEDHIVAFFTKLLGRLPAFIGGVNLWTDVDGRKLPTNQVEASGP